METQLHDRSRAAGQVSSAGSRLLRARLTLPRRGIDLMHSAPLAGERAE